MNLSSFTLTQLSNQVAQLTAELNNLTKVKALRPLTKEEQLLFNVVSSYLRLYMNEVPELRGFKLC